MGLGRAGLMSGLELQRMQAFSALVLEAIFTLPY
jgi:hypothetical protein